MKRTSWSVVLKGTYVVLMLTFLIAFLNGCDLAGMVEGDDGQTSGPESTPSITEFADELAEMEQAIFQKINQYRRSEGLSELKWNETIADVCRVHSLNMASGSAPFSHDGFDQRVDTISESIRLWAAGENLAYNNYRNPVDTAVDGWLKSPGHHRNIVGNFKMTGVGVAEGRNGTYYFTQIFILN